MLTTYQTPWKASPLASLVLLLTLLQGSSLTLNLAVSWFQSATLASLVTVLWLFTYMLTVLGLFTAYGMNWITWTVRYRLPLVLLLAGAMASAAWSLDANLTFDRSIHLIGCTLIALYLGFSLPLTRILDVTAVALGVLLVASVIVSLLVPILGIEAYEGQQAWKGVTNSKNTLGFWSAIACLLFVTVASWWRAWWQRALLLMLTGVALVCLAHSLSATSVLALLISALVMLYLYAAFSLRLGLAAMTVLGVLVLVLAALAFHFIDTAELIGRSDDLTGRGTVWAQTWQLVLQRPLTGFGYGALWFPTDASLWIQQSLFDFSWTVFHAHNGVLQVASEIGLPLTALLLFMTIQQLVETVYCQYQRQQSGVLFVLGFSVALLVSNYSEARLLVNRELWWILFIALPVSMLQQVTLTATDAASPARFNPVPAPLSTRARQKASGGRAKRDHRRALKDRLRHRRLSSGGNDDSDDASVVSTVTPANAKSTGGSGKTTTAVAEKRLRRKRKSG